MSTSMTVRDIDPGDMAWLRREAGRAGMSVEELVRRLIHEKRTRDERRPTPSEIFEHHFGEKRGVELPPRVRFGYKPLSLIWRLGGMTANRPGAANIVVD